MKQYYKTTKIGKSFITHQDQEKDGLKFQCFGDITIIEGDSIKSRLWSERTNSTEMSETKALEEIEIKRVKNINSRISELKNEIEELKITL